MGENGVGLRVLDAGLDGVYIDRAVRHGVTVIGSLTGVYAEGTPDAGELTNGRYTLYAGYWAGPMHYDLYLPVVSRP